MIVYKLLCIAIVLIVSPIFASQDFGSIDTVLKADYKEDTIYIREINFNIQNRTKEYVLENTLRYYKGDVYSAAKVKSEIRRLDEHRIFHDITAVTEIDSGYADISYFVHDKIYWRLLPQVHLVGIPDSSITLTSVSGRLNLKNVTGNNETYEVYGEVLSPFSFSGSDLAWGNEFFRYNFSTSIYNESLTKGPYIFGLYGDYLNVSSPKKRHLDEKKISGGFIAGRKNNRFQGIRTYLGGSNKTVTIDTTSAIYYSIKYPYAIIEWSFDESDFRYYPSFKNSAYLRANKVGLKSSQADFFLFEAGGSVIRSPLFFKTMLKTDHRFLLFDNKIFSDQYLFSGGASSNRGYSFNTLPLVRETSSQDNRKGVIVNDIQSEIAIPFLKIGPFQNFYWNYATTRGEVAIWADFTHIRDKQKEDRYYYSYGVGLRGWFINFFEFGAINLSNNRENEIKILFSSSFVF